MSIVLKKAISVFLLLVFLIPVAYKSVHDFSHRDDVHCTAKTEKHFHKYEHHCIFCDVTQPLFGTDDFDGYGFGVSFGYKKVSFELPVIFTSLNFGSNNLRGPPII